MGKNFSKLVSSAGVRFWITDFGNDSNEVYYISQHFALTHQGPEV